MNLLDLLPVDLLPWAAGYVGIDHIAGGRERPTVNTTLAMAITVFLLTQYIGISEKGLLHYFEEFFTGHFKSDASSADRARALELLLHIIQELSRPLSLSLRLFGNMYAGRADIRVIAGLTLESSFAHFSTYGWGLVQFAADVIWTLFHILIITCKHSFSAC